MAMLEDKNGAHKTAGDQSGLRFDGTESCSIVKRCDLRVLTYLRDPGLNSPDNCEGVG